MVNLREIPRTAVFAWSPGTGKPLLVTGTRAGAVDSDFSAESKLELWDLSLNSATPNAELQPVASVPSDSKFYDIAWGPSDEDHPRGIIAAALENGSLELYDAEKLAAGASDALIDRATKHTGAIKTVQFNPLKPQILATAGAKGELFIYNVEDIENPFRLGNAAASRPDDIETLAWNKKVSHILATGSAGGLITVWDVKTKKASLNLSNNRKPVSSIAWDPTNSTKLIAASPDDNTPVIYLWNLRNSNAPEKTLAGHESGVLSLAWCPQDPNILLSCGKDNRTLVWNPNTGESFGELQEGTNWAFQTGFNPEKPDLVATASFDGKITVQTLQDTNNSAAAQEAAQNNLDAEDFFATAHAAPKITNFSLPTPPSWSLRPIGSSFGFGGKFVYFTTSDAQTSTIHITSFSADAEIAPTTEKFEEALKSGDIKSICDAHIEQSKTEEEKADWEVLETLLDANSRKKVIQHLGFKADEAEAEAEAEAEEAAPAAPAAPAAAETAETEADAEKKKRLSNFFGDDEDAGADDDFLGLSSTTDAAPDAAPDAVPDAAPDAAPTATPFHLLGQGNTSLEDSITKAIMLGDFSRAVGICLKENRIADAFVIANCGGKELVQKVQNAYLAGTSGAPSYLRLIGSVISEDLTDVVRHADLANWKEALATVCTFSKPDEFSGFCEILGDRVLAAGSRKDASFCYLVGSKLEKVVNIWIAELEEAEVAGAKEDTDASSYSLHAKSLQQFIEKVTVFRQVAKFVDAESSLTSGWKLASLYDKYIEYADIVASAGLMSVAQKYLDLVPTTYEAAELARGRVKLATKPAVHQRGAGIAKTRTPVQRAPLATTGYAPPQPMANTGYAPPQPLAQPTMPSATPTRPYAPPTAAPTPAPNPYAPAGAAPTNPYAPAGAAPTNPYALAGAAPTNPYAPPTTTPAYGAQGYAPTMTQGYAPPNMYGAPPQRTAPPSMPPPRDMDAGSWNDVPIVTKLPVRKSTPSVAPITSPFGAQQSFSGPPPPAGASSYVRANPTPPPPPPKAGAAPPRVMSPLAPPPGVGASIPRPSSAASAYAPPPPAAHSGPTPLARPPPRTESPYNAPPQTTAPPSNRYAPAPSSQPAASGGYAPHGTHGTHGMPPMAPPPGRTPSGQYAPPAAYGASPSTLGQPPIAPPPSSVPPPPAAGGPPRANPGSAVSAAAAVAAAAAAAATAATPPPPPQTSTPPPKKTKHPSGDRSHIPASAQKMVQVLEGEWQRVAARAPESFKPQVNDTRKRLNLLFDHLNNGELVKEATIGQLGELAAALEGKAYDVAAKIQVDVHREKPEECGQWMVGVKRLIAMSKATP